jgi:large subunit ribosomal protein L23
MLITKRNTLTFVVDSKSTKSEIKKELEKEYSVKVESVNVHLPFRGGKRALVRLAKENSAMDLASKLKIL